jgi:N-methylhydantoinase A/oxoprolinase/acetone carboxylase beta subunit
LLGIRLRPGVVSAFTGVPADRVPDESAQDGRLAFPILAAEGIEVMYQTVVSITGDTVASASDKTAFRTEPQQATLYIEVADLAQVESKLSSERLVMPKRKTFYGATELGYADPAGNIVIFSEHGES